MAKQESETEGPSSEQPMKRHVALLADSLSISKQQVAATIQLIDEGNTLPFIARYRKEATGGLDDEQLRLLIDQLEVLRSLDERRRAIIAAIEEQQKMTPELHHKLMTASTRSALEDLYQPFKQRRHTRAESARKRGLQPLADQILQQPVSGPSALVVAAQFVGDEVPTPEDALAGARDVVAELISSNAEVRRVVREKTLRWGTVAARKIKDADDEKAVFKIYYDFDLRIDRLRPHQVLALNRGEALKVLRVAIETPERDWYRAITSTFRTNRSSPFADQMGLAIEDAAKRLLLPAIERDVRRTLAESADAHAINVFASNLRSLLSQPPLSGFTVLAIDPGYRTGCKIAVVDPMGKLLDTATIYPHPPQRKLNEAMEVLRQIVSQHSVNLIAVGNGTASQETEELVANLIQSVMKGQSSFELHYLMVNEAGASVYSASAEARAEFPELDVSMRSGISIARRVQDPLAELVKIDPKSIGVGLYQHDVDQGKLSRSLDGVVENVVNRVGVDVNTASAALLTHVAGIGPKLADSIVAYRDNAGRFTNRNALKKVPGLGAKSYEQSAGFLRVNTGDEPLDASAIHPESYGVARKLLAKAGLNEQSHLAERTEVLSTLQKQAGVAVLAEELGVGQPTLEDILEQLARPGRDPREDLPAPLLRSDVLSIDELPIGLRLDGTVRNVVDFGAFIDIGVKQDGLLHRSQIPLGTVLNVGDILTIEVLNVEAERGRISLGWAE